LRLGIGGNEAGRAAAIALGAAIAPRILMQVRRSERIAGFGLACSALLLAAGLFASLSSSGIAIASALLTVAGVVASAGVAAFRGHPWDMSVWALLAAALPMFGIFYAIGLLLLRWVGQAIAGDLLIAIAAVLPVVTGFIALQSHRRATR